MTRRTLYLTIAAIAALIGVGAVIAGTWLVVLAMALTVSGQLIGLRRDPADGPRRLSKNPGDY